MLAPGALFAQLGPPLAGGHIHPAIGQKGDALLLEQGALHPFAAKGKALAQRTVLKHHAVAGDLARQGVFVQGVAHGARVAGRAQSVGDLPVICDLAARDAPREFVDLLVKTCRSHGCFFARRRGCGAFFLFFCALGRKPFASRRNLHYNINGGPVCPPIFPHEVFE